MISPQDYYLRWEPDFQSKKKANDFARVFASIHVIPHKKVSRVTWYNVIVLLLFVLICHFFEHMEEIRVLSMDVSKNFYWCLELNKRPFIFKFFLNFFDEKLDNLKWQINVRNILWVFSFVENNIVVQIKDNYVHDKSKLVVHFFLRDARKAFSKLTAPFFLNVKSLLFVLSRLQIPIKKSLQLLSIWFLSQILLMYCRNESIHVLRDWVLVFVNFRGCASSTLHFRYKTYKFKI